MLKRLYTCRVVCFIFLFSLSSISAAVVITSTKSQYEPAGVRYYFTVTDWDSGVPLCNDTSATRCTLIIAGARSPDDFMGLISDGRSWSVTPSSMQNVYSQMNRQGFSVPYDGSILVPKGTQTSSRFCITFAQGYSWASSGGAVTPIGPCAPVIPAALQCDVRGNTTISHRELFSDAIDGNEAQTQLQLTCTGASSVIVNTTADDEFGVKLRTNEGLYSKLTIDGKSTARGVSINVAGNWRTNISLKSTLVTKGVVKPGEFSGSTVLTISPP